jgi:two-component system response regulator YesN
VEYRYLARNPIVCYAEIQKQFLELEKVSYPLQFVEKIMEGLKTANSELLSNLLDEYFARIKQRKVEIAHFKSVMMELLFVLRKELKSINIDLSKVFIDEFEDIYSIHKKDSLEDVWKVVVQFVMSVFNYIETTANKSNKQIIKEVMKLIDGSYSSNELTLNDVAEKVYLTPNYVSMLIKKETGQNFSDIILRKRIEKAKELLFDKTLKTYEIAEKVGYADQNYFFKAFRKVVRMTPGEFRNKFCG